MVLGVTIRARLVFLCAVAVGAFSALITPAMAQSSPAVDRETVVIGTDVMEPDTLSPLFEPGLVTSWYEIIPVLFTIDVPLDNAWRRFPQGVEYLPSLHNGTWKLDGERMILTWKIKSRNWHDGRPVTCGDYVFSHRVALDERVRLIQAARDSANRIASVTCPRGAGAREISVVWKGHYAYANLNAIGQIARLPRHLVEPFFRENPSTLRTAAYGTASNLVIGDGAYRLVDWQKGVAITLEAVPQHAIFGTPRLKRIIWRFMEGVAHVRSALQAGTIDATIGSLDTDGAAVLERQGPHSVRVFYVPSLTWEHIDFNLDNPLLQDVRIRRAIVHAINRSRIVQQLFSGKQPVANSYLPPKHPGYTGAMQIYPYDPARARALLREAGFGQGPDGIMRDAAGRALTLEINTTAGDRTREQVEEMIREQLGQIGIGISIVNFPVRVFFGELVTRRKFKAMAMYAWVIGPETDCDLLYTSDRIPSETNGWLGWNFPGYRSTEADRLCKAIARELDSDRRRTLLNESARVFSRDLPAIPLYFRVSISAAKAELRNFTMTGLPDAEVWNAHQWYWEGP